RCGHEQDEAEREREPERRLPPQKVQEPAQAAAIAGGPGRRDVVVDDAVAERLDAPLHVVPGGAAAPLDRLRREGDADFVDAVELGEPALYRLRAAPAVHAADLESERLG